MTDEADRAQALEEAEREAAIRAASARRADQAQLVIDGVVRCVDCGGRIPRGRLRAAPGAARCVECEGLRERRDGRGD